MDPLARPPSHLRTWLPDERARFRAHPWMLHAEGPRRWNQRAPHLADPPREKADSPCGASGYGAVIENAASGVVGGGAGCLAQSRGEDLLRDRRRGCPGGAARHRPPLPRAPKTGGRTREALAPTTTVFSADLPRVRRGTARWVQISDRTNSVVLVGFARAGSVPARAPHHRGAGLRQTVCAGHPLGQNVNAYGGARVPRTVDSPISCGIPPRSMGCIAWFHDLAPQGCLAGSHPGPGLLPVVCEHLTLPGQSGSDRILRAMRRMPSTRADYPASGAPPGKRYPTWRYQRSYSRLPGSPEDDFNKR